MWLFRFLTSFIFIVKINSTLQPKDVILTTTIVEDYDIVIPTKHVKDTSLIYYHIEGTYNSTGRPYSAYVATFPSNRFAFYPSSKDGCVELIKTSITSYDNYQCEYATNGAFFDSTLPSYCEGNLVSDGKIWQLPTDGSGTNRANFGILSNGSIITGFINSTTISNNEFAQLITGWGWLVRNGVSNVNQSQDLSFQPDGFTYEKAPRTAIGIYKNSTMVSLVIDGEEDIQAGPDLFEVAELLVMLGVESAVNIDGGGSSVATYQGLVIDEPTCNDTPEICERSVASITCVKSI